MARRFLVLHGWENHRPTDHWQYWLTERLRQRGERRPELVCTDADPWCAEGAAAIYGSTLDVDVHTVVGGGHLAAEDGYGPWPEVERWALSGVFAQAPATVR